MCMIIVKEKGVAIPEKMNDYIDYSYTSNNDGMGIALWKKDSNFVLIKKDFKKLKKLKRFIKNNVDKEDALVIHLRLASAGNKSFVNRHPFSLEVKKLNKLECKTSMAVAHNGTFTDLRSFDSKFSDTYIFVKEILSDPVIKNNLKRKSIKQLLEKFIGHSRIVILDYNGDCIYFGNWKEEDGLKFSNSGYKKREYNFQHYSPYEYYLPTHFSTNYLDKKSVKEPYFCERCGKYDKLEYINGEWLCELCRNLKKSEESVGRYYFCERCGKYGKLEYIEKYGKWLCEDCKKWKANTKKEDKKWTCEFCQEKTENLYFLEGLYMCKKCYDYFNKEVK